MFFLFTQHQGHFAWELLHYMWTSLPRIVFLTFHTFCDKSLKMYCVSDIQSLLAWEVAFTYGQQSGGLFSNPSWTEAAVLHQWLLIKPPCKVIVGQCLMKKKKSFWWNNTFGWLTLLSWSDTVRHKPNV